MLIYNQKLQNRHSKGLRCKDLYTNYQYEPFSIPTTANERKLDIFVRRFCGDHYIDNSTVDSVILKAFMEHILDPYSPIRSINLSINIKQSKKDIGYTMSYILNKISRRIIMGLEDVDKIHQLVFGSNYIGSKWYFSSTVSYEFCRSSSKQRIPLISNIKIYTDDRCPKSIFSPKYDNRYYTKYMNAYYYSTSNLGNNMDTKSIILENMVAKVHMKPIYLRQ